MLLVWRQKSKLDSSIKQHSKLQKHQTDLSFQRLHEGIAPKIADFYHISGEINPAGIPSNLGFWQDDTAHIWNKDGKQNAGDLGSDRIQSKANKNSHDSDSFALVTRSSFLSRH